MKTIYIDSENKCHTVNDGTMVAVETDFFDSKCDTFVEGFCCEVNGNDTVIYPCKLYSELAAAQQEYERQLLTDYESALSEIETALGV